LKNLENNDGYKNMKKLEFIKREIKISNQSMKGKQSKHLKKTFFTTRSVLLLSRTSPKGCPKHQGHKEDPGVTPGTCGAGGEKAQVILVWVRAPGVGNASHPRRLGVMRKRPWAMRSSWREDSRMLKNTSFGGVS
jgi:hypothetical protein